MKTENEFNRYLREKMNFESVKAFKMSDRFQIGAADWLIFAEGRVVAIESKFIKKVGSRGSLLKHPVTGPQITFMRGLEKVDVPGWILIGVGEERKMYLAFWDIFIDGNIDVKVFRSKLEEGDITSYGMNDVGELLNSVF